MDRFSSIIISTFNFVIHFSWKHKSCTVHIRNLNSKYFVCRNHYIQIWEWILPSYCRVCSIHSSLVHPNVWFLFFDEIITRNHITCLAFWVEWSNDRTNQNPFTTWNNQFSWSLVITFSFTFFSKLFNTNKCCSIFHSNTVCYLSRFTNLAFTSSYLFAIPCSCTCGREICFFYNVWQLRILKHTTFWHRVFGGIWSRDNYLQIFG